MRIACVRIKISVFVALYRKKWYFCTGSACGAACNILQMEQHKKRLFLIDAMGLIYRSYYALNKNPRINSKGKNTSAVLGFANSLYEIIRKENPSHIGVSFDSFGPTLRHAGFSDYKANRESTPEDIVACLPDIRNLIAAFRIPLLELPGYEADDIIGTVAKRAEKLGFEVYMVTADKDYGQLVSDHVFMYRPSHLGSGFSVLGVPEVCEKYSIRYPEQLIDLLGLWGDSSDNIPGIRGVGEVTAKKLVAQFGTIENMLAHTEQIANEKLRLKVQEGAESALQSKMLATIMLDVPLPLNEPDFRLQRPDSHLLRPVLEELEFRQLLKRIQTDYPSLEGSGVLPGLFDADPDSDADAASSMSTIRNTPHDYRLVDTFEELLRLGERMAESPAFCFDTETDSLDVLHLNIVGLSVCMEAGSAFFVLLPEDEAEAGMWLTVLQPVFEDPKVLKVAQNLKFDLQALQRYGVRIGGPCFDTMLAHYLLEPEQKHNMDQLAFQYLSYETVSYAEMLGGRKRLRDVPVDILKDYACEDADITFRLYQVFEPLLHEREAWELFEKVEMPLVPVLAAMERKGVRVDTGYLKQYSGVLQERMAALEQQIYALAGEPFNIASPKQLGGILFEKLRIVDNAKLTKTKQYQTGEDVLQKLVHKHPIVQAVLDYRGLQKLRSTYTEAFQQLVDPQTGRVHTSFNQAVTATGRLSSSNPNLQNIPVRNEEGREIRKAFVPADENHRLLAADYSQIELRIMAAMSGDDVMQEAFRQGTDIHASTAARIFHVGLGEVTRDMRRMAKTVNFGIIYGISAFGLSERLNVPRREASELIAQYFEHYPAIREYMERQKAFALEHGYVETLCKRRRYLPDIRSHNAVVRGVAERNAVNAPIQGSAADMIKIAMIRIHTELEKRQLRSSIVLQVHDELVLDVWLPELEEVRALVREAMLEALSLPVPLEVDIQSGNNWLEAH